MINNWDSKMIITIVCDYKNVQKRAEISFQSKNNSINNLFHPSLSLNLHSK